MSLEIVDSCVSCHACLPMCPSEAISVGDKHLVINKKKCTECEGDYADSQCAAICPIEGAIVYGDTGLACNPPGSLTGIPPHKMEEAMREMQAR